MKLCDVCSTCLVKKLCHNRQFTTGSAIPDQGVSIWSMIQELVVNQPALILLQKTSPTSRIVASQLRAGWDNSNFFYLYPWNYHNSSSNAEFDSKMGATSSHLRTKSQAETRSVGKSAWWLCWNVYFRRVLTLLPYATYVSLHFTLYWLIASSLAIYFSKDFPNAPRRIRRRFVN